MEENTREQQAGVDGTLDTMQNDKPVQMEMTLEDIIPLTSAAEQKRDAEAAQEQQSHDEESSCLEGCCCTGGWRRLFCRDTLKQLFMPWKQGSSDVTLPDVPMYLKVLCAFSLLLMLNQVRFPVWGGCIALGDLGFLLGFIPVFLYGLKSRRPFFLPLLSIVVVFSSMIVNFISGPGVSGGIEICQLLEVLVCGVLLLSFFIEVSPWLAVSVVVLSFLLNLGIAGYQGLRLGFGSVLAPADVLLQKWGFGGAYNGLFRSRMAFSFFMALVMTWLLPVIHGKRCCVCRWLALVVTAAIGFTAMVYGQMYLLTALLLVPGMFLMSRRGGVAVLVALVISLVVITELHPVAQREAWLSTLTPLKTAYHPGELKTSHLDAVAALKMFAQRPWTGVGSGRYQECIGRCYGELPNPVKNDIECDTQSGWGIQLGTTGIVTAGLLFVLLAGMAAGGIRRYFVSSSVNTLAFGGGLTLLLFMAGMVVSDGMTRGLGWMLALAIASALVPNPSEAVPSGVRVSAWMLLLVLVLSGILLIAVVARGRAEDPLPRMTPCGESCQVSSQPAVIFKKIVYAADALKITSPFEQGTDSRASRKQILKVPDGKGVPPEGAAPAMEYGGAVFTVELPETAECRIWLRVWWDGACGNTVNLQVDDEPTSVTVGNDGTYRSWHWLPSTRVYQLSAGLHTVTLLNREDGIMFDQMLVTNDAQYIPQDIEEE